MSMLPPPQVPEVATVPAQGTPASRTRWLIPVVALIVGVGGGILIGRATAPSDNGDDTVAPVSTPAPASTVTPGDSVAPADTSVAPQDTTSDTTVVPSTTEPSSATPAAPDASPFVTAYGGAEQVPLPEGSAGMLGAIANGPYDTAAQTLPVLVRNMTATPMVNVSLSGVARDSAGALVGSGEDQGVEPAVIGPGEIGWGYLYFGAELPAGAVFEITAAGDPQDDSSFGSVPLEVTELNVTADTIVGIATNSGTDDVTGPISVSVLCLSPDGTQLAIRTDFATVDTVAPGATAAFTVNFYGDPPCERFLVAASGYNF